MSKRIRQLGPAVLCAMAALALSGCYDTRQEIILNPDSSGRAVLESSFVQFDWLNGNAPIGEEAAAAFVRKLVQEAEGVDAWRDITCREQEDGRMFLRATAYFPDLRKFKTEVNGALRFTAARDGAGALTIEPKPDRSHSPVSLPATNEPVTLESIQRERRQFRALQALMSAVLAGIKLETTFKLPGAIKSASNFERTGTNEARIRFEGLRMLSAVERFLFDPEVARLRLEGKSPADVLENDEVNELAYGQRGPVRVVARGQSRPAFDYTAEVAAARRDFPGLARSFGLTGEDGSLAGAGFDGSAARITVTGVDWRYDQLAQRRSFQMPIHQPAGYTLKLRAELPGTVLDVKEVRVLRVITIEGTPLQAKDVSNFGPVSTHEVSGLTNIFFDVPFGLPPARSRGLSELSGEIECSSLQNLRTVELISGRLQTGARGKEFKTEIESIGSPAADEQRLVLRTDLPQEQLRWLRVYSDSYQMLELSQRGTVIMGTHRSLTFIARKPLPKTGRLVASLLIGDQRMRIPFALTNVSLLGQPLAAR